MGVVQKYPAGQAPMADELAGQNEPGCEAHEMGADELGGQNDPAGHALMAVLDMTEPPGQKEPPGHATQAPWDE